MGAEGNPNHTPIVGRSIYNSHVRHLVEFYYVWENCARARPQKMSTDVRGVRIMRARQTPPDTVEVCREIVVLCGAAGRQSIKFSGASAGAIVAREIYRVRPRVHDARSKATRTLASGEEFTHHAARQYRKIISVNKLHLPGACAHRERV